MSGELLIQILNRISFLTVKQVGANTIDWGCFAAAGILQVGLDSTMESDRDKTILKCLGLAWKLRFIVGA